MDFNGRVTRVVLKDFLQTRLSHPTDISNLFENDEFFVEAWFDQSEN
jgi:hypothetical protein